VRRLRSDAELWQALSAEGQRIVQREHGVDVVAAQLLTVLRAA
jgi:hypothetical protein